MSAPFVRLEIGWADHPALITAGLAGRGIHATALCLASTREGAVHRNELVRHGATNQGIDNLVDLGMLLPLGGDRFEPEGWHPAIEPTRRHIPVQLRREVYHRDGNRCLACGTGEDLSLDHIIPYSRGGPDTLENLRTLCRPCNSSKGDQTPEEWGA